MRLDPLTLALSGVFFVPLFMLAVFFTTLPFLKGGQKARGLGFIGGFVSGGSAAFAPFLMLGGLFESQPVSGAVLLLWIFSLCTIGCNRLALRFFPDEKPSGPNVSSRNKKIYGGIFAGVSLLLVVFPNTQLWQQVKDELWPPPPAVVAPPPVDPVALQTKAETGDVKAAHDLADAYFYPTEGMGQTDIPEAMKWYKKAAEGGDSDAQEKLGTAYWFGDGVEKDMALAEKWILKAAEQGNASAESDLFLLYEKEKPEEAVKWFLKGAAGGKYNNAWVVSDMYAEGRGVAQDNVEAYFWLQLCGVVGKSIDVKRDSLVSHMTPEQVKATDKRIEEWRKLHPPF